MLYNILKKTIIFFIPFLLINNIYAVDSMIQYKYKTDDSEYVITFTIDEKLNMRNTNVMVFSSDNNGIGKKVTIKPLNQLLNVSLDTERPFGFTDLEHSYKEYYGYGMNKDFYNELISNPEKYKPLLLFDENNNAVIIGSYFDKDVFEETYEAESYNLNDNKEYIDKLLNGQLTFIPEKANLGIKPINVYKDLKLKEKQANYQEVNNTKVDSKNEKDNASITKGECEKYTLLLKNLKENIVGNDTKKGACSTESIKKMQLLNNIYDLKKSFDSSLLEPECKELIYGEKGYINIINSAQTFYNGLDETVKNSSLICYDMQTKYLEGISILTQYKPEITIDTSKCELIDQKTMDFLENLFKTIKVLVTALCIFLCITDVYKLIITKENDGAKVKSKITKRIIALILVYLTPVIVNIIVKVLNERYIQNNPIKCGSIINEG